MVVDLVLLVVVLNSFLALLLTGCLIFYDSCSRGSDYAKRWGVASALIPFIALIYLFWRGNIGERNVSVKRGERIGGTILVASISSWFFSFVLSPPDPITIGYNSLYVFPLGLVVGYIIVGRNGWICQYI